MKYAPELKQEHLRRYSKIFKKNKVLIYLKNGKKQITIVGTLGFFEGQKSMVACPYNNNAFFDRNINHSWAEFERIPLYICFILAPWLITQKNF
jgi:hypothetical protein|tara:strand:- start:82 stop:363 length:282 start_codon:yes stop_codon:yes gene_type:complete